MTGGRSLARTLRLVLRAQKRAIARQRFGVCRCGRPISQHFDVLNKFLACDPPAGDAERGR